ncbi:MarR family winged helix-turn-helix transcriptional regulator [Pusillimonas noertemannii]|uniref:MarR family winged helix-turn-helix transcriptional regulator n=1 Tax=Pusillimonas noertemannii TaxID=305977 RepID=UPI0002F3147D|nr:MarR family transcriptional regulator [Pusillimonas noertemannii]
MTKNTRRLPGTSASENYDFSEQVGHLLRRAYQRHTALFQQTIPDTQLTAAQFVVLCSIRDSGACSLSQIVKQTAIDQATIRGVIDRLKARKFVSVRHDEMDRRKVLVSLTEAGQSLVESMVPFAFEITEKTFNGFNPAERMALLYLLNKMCDGDGDGDEEE